MNNPWKLASIGMALVLATALVTGVTTAYLVRPAAPDASVIPAPAARPVTVPSRPARVRPAVYHPAMGSAALAPVVQAATVPASANPAAAALPGAPAPSVQATAPAPPAADCARGSDRAWRIAKPGLLGGLIGAGIGAAGGAIADGGSGAGKGALIGGLAGVAAGAGYGAWRTKSECGAVFGDAAPGDRVAITHPR